MGSLLTRKVGEREGGIGKKRKTCKSKSTFHESTQGGGGELGKKVKRRCRLGERKVVGLKKNRRKS